MRGFQSEPLAGPVRIRALGVGCWCASLQLSLIYGLSYYWSATPATAIYVLLGWICGGIWATCSVWKFSRWAWAMPLLPMLLFVTGNNIPLLIAVLSSILGGRTAGHWLLLREQFFISAMRWESLGMVTGYLMTGLAAYHGAQALSLWVVCVTAMLIWREEPWRCAGEPSP